MQKDSMVRACALAALAALAAAPAAADYAADCRAAQKRKRNVIYYELGYNPCLWPKGKPFSVSAFRSMSSANDSLDSYARTKVNIDSFVYVPIGGFACLSAKIPGVDAPVAQPNPQTRYLAGTRNALSEFFKAGTDPLAEVCKWARENKKEMICCMPLNNLDLGTDEKSPPGMWGNYFMSPWKKKNPTSLMGNRPSGDKNAKTKDGKPVNPPFGHRLAVDYGKTEVRAEFLRECTEIANKYDIDGIMLDFTHDPYIFSTVAWGDVASSKDLADLTDMVTKIKAACDAAGQKKNHPILLSIRIPDDTGYCKAMGLDVDVWAEQKLFAFVTTARFELNPSSYMGELSKKWGVPYYKSCGVSYIFTGNDSGYPDDDERPGLTRQGPHCFRGRAMDAYKGGAAGVMYWNPTRWHRFPLRALAPSPDEMKYENKRYCVTYQDAGQMGSALRDGKKYCKLPALRSGAPVDLGKGAAKYNVNVWDDLPALKKEGKKVPIVRLTTEVSLPSGIEVAVTLNGKQLKLRKKRAGSQVFDVPYEVAKYGPNEVIVKTGGKNKRGLTAKLGNIAMDVIFNEDDGEVAQ